MERFIPDPNSELSIPEQIFARFHKKAPEGSRVPTREEVEKKMREAGFESAGNDGAIANRIWRTNGLYF